MDIEAEKEAIRQLKLSHEARTKMGRLRELYDVIEEARLSGVPNKKILEKLNELGYELTLKTFESMIHRIRKERESVGSSTPRRGTNAIASPSNSSITPKSTGLLSTGPDSNKPDDSRRITDPGKLKSAREREINLTDYLDSDT